MGTLIAQDCQCKLCIRDKQSMTRVEMMQYKCDTCYDTRNGKPLLTVSIEIGKHHIVRHICPFCGIDALKKYE